MSSTSIIILALILIVSVLLVVVVMVQNPKGGGLSSSFGGGGGQQMGGVKRTNDFLTKSTWTLATALLVLILLYNVTSLKGSSVPESKLMNGNAPVSAPAAQQPSADQTQTKAVQPTKTTKTADKKEDTGK